MDMSDPSSIDLDTMGNILATSNENNSQADETDQTTQNEPSLTSGNVEVTECQTEKILDISTQDIDLLIMDKSSDSVTAPDTLPQTANSMDNLNISESDDNVEDLWLTGETRELVKVETDEDFDVIVKSLETAIVGADKVPIMSPILVPQSIVEPDCCDPVLSEMAEHDGEQILLSENVQMTDDDITKELDVEASKLQTEVSDQCLESLIDTSIMTSEFATISDDTFDEQSSSLFDATQAVSVLTDTTDSRPSLLELQQANMTCDIAEAINRDDDDVLPLIQDTLLNDNSLDSTGEILSDIVNKSIASEAQIDEAIGEDEVDEVMLEFPATVSADINDENIAAEMLDESIGLEAQPFVEESVEIQRVEEQEIEEKTVEEIDAIRCSETSEANVEEKRVELTETVTSEEQVVKSEENVTETVKCDSQCAEVLSTDVEIQEKHETNSDIDIANIENLTDGDIIFDETEAMVENEINNQLETAQEDCILTETEVDLSETKTEEVIIKDLETDIQTNINSGPLELTDTPTECLVETSQSEVKVKSDTETQAIETAVSETSVEQLPVEDVTENQDQLTVASENVRLENVPVGLEESLDQARLVLEESVDKSLVKVVENKQSVTVQESVDRSRDILDNQLSLTAEEHITLTSDKCSTNPEQSVTVPDISQETAVKTPAHDDQITKSQVDERKFTAPIDKPKDNEDSNHTGTSSSEAQTPIVEDHVRQASDPVEKEQSPPKKIKLIREKLYIPPVNISTVLPPLDTLPNVTAKVASSENATEPKISENIKLFSVDTVQQIQEDLSELKEQNVVEKTSPVRTRKLKLKRDYEPEQVVSRLEADVIKPEECVTKDTEEMPRSVVTEQESVKPAISETISDNVPVLCEAQNVTSDVEEPIAEQEIKMDSEIELKADEEIDTATDDELKVNLSVDTNTQVPISEHKSTEPGWLEVNVESASEVSDAKQVEVSELPVTCAVDVPIVLDNNERIAEDITEACDTEKPLQSSESVPENISPSAEQVNPEDNPSAMPDASTDELPQKILQETEVICENTSQGTEEIASVAPQAINVPVEAKLSILQQMLMKDIVVPTKGHKESSSLVEEPSDIFAHGMEPARECETRIVRSENELLEAATDAERAAESTIEDELLQAAKEVETRIDGTNAENDDELKQAAQEAETRDEHAAATLDADETAFEENSVSICEDEIIAVTQALEMERAQENLVEICKTESILEAGMESNEIDTGPSLEPTDRRETGLKLTPIIEQIQEVVVGELAKGEDNKLKRHIEDTATTTSAVAAKKSKSNRDADTTVFGRKPKASPGTDDSVSIETIEVASRQSVTIEPAICSQSGVESVGKLRISRRKLEEPPVLSKSVTTITKPLRVEVDDLGNSAMSPSSYFSDLTAENVPKIVIKPIPKPEERSSPKITIKPILKPSDTVLSPKASKSKSSDDPCTPRITIKPIMKPDPLKITITKQKMDDTHSILKIYKPEEGTVQFEEKNIPKLTIKPVGKGDEMQHSPRITIKPVKPPSQHSPSTSVSPKITVKPVLPPNEQSRVEISHSPKITVKSVVNPEDSYPKVTIKPILRPDEPPMRGPMSPRQIKLKTMTFESSSGVTVEPVAPLMQNVDAQQMSPLKISVKPFAKMEETLSPKLTIKPITKTCEIVQSEDGSSNPLKLTIKPILKPEESYQSPKITIKPIMKPEKVDHGAEEMDKPERIILKIQKTNLPSPKERATHSKESRKEPEVKIEAIMQDPDRSQKLSKIKLKLTKEGSHAQIIPSIPSILSEQFSLKRPLLFSETASAEKRSRSEFSGTELLHHNSDISINLVEPNAKPNPKTISEEVTIVKLDRTSSGGATPLAEHISQSKFKEMLLKIQQKADITCTPHIEPESNSSGSDDVKIVGVGVLASNPLQDPLSIHDESSSQDVVIVNEVINTNPFHNVQIINAHTITDPSAQQTPKKRGRPRKNPLEVKPEIKGEDCVEIVRPKRTCRAPPGRTPFAVKERKPRGAGRARGGGRGRGGARSPPKSPKEPKTPRGKALKEAKALAKLEAAKLAQEIVIDEITIEDSTNDTTPIATPVPPVEEPPAKKLADEQAMTETELKLAQVSEELLKEPPQHLPPPVAAVYEEETRMSADNSRAQTPARQVIAAPQLEGPEESQSSVQSSATTESNKNKKGRLEVCDPDSAVTAVDQIVEYSWGAGGTYMLQEQIAQFLGVKSFKRKYPGLTRRPVEMQERDYIREKGLVSESMCDMGLTAVPSSEILDIMYTDFQEKYEEYRKCMRDKQSKEISNKQKAISLATSQEKNKIDFKERAIRSAANWNVNFNKTRKESRRCCMDLQTFTINFPLGRTQCKTPQKSPVGQYPIALVPGQFTDYYKRYTSNELHYLPLNTVRYGPVMPNQHCTDAGQSDGSQSDTDTSSGSDSDSSDDSMSTVEDTPATTGFGKPGMNLSLVTPKAKVH